MRKTEALKILKRITNEKMLRNFQVDKYEILKDVIFVSCSGEHTNICATYKRSDNEYHLSINYEGFTLKNFTEIFTKEFSKQVFKAIYMICFEMERKKDNSFIEEINELNKILLNCTHTFSCLHDYLIDRGYDRLSISYEEIENNKNIIFVKKENSDKKIIIYLKNIRIFENNICFQIVKIDRFLL